MGKESNANLSESGSAVKDNGENIITQETAQKKLEEATQKLQDNNDQQTSAEAERKPIADRLELNRPKLQETEQKLGIAEKKRNTLSTAIQNNSKRITEIEAEITGLTSNVSTLSPEEVQEKLKKLQTEKADKEKDNAEKKPILEQTKKDIAVLEAEKAKLSKAISDDEALIKPIEARLAQLKVDWEPLQKKESQLRAESKGLAEVIDKWQREAQRIQQITQDGLKREAEENSRKEQKITQADFNREYGSYV